MKYAHELCLIELHCRQPRIQPATRDQLGMRAGVDDLAAFHHHDAAAALHGGVALRFAQEVHRTVGAAGDDQAAGGGGQARDASVGDEGACWHATCRIPQAHGVVV